MRPGEGMAADMAEQPAVLRAILAQPPATLSAVTDGIRRKAPGVVLFAARGTSDHNPSAIAQVLVHDWELFALPLFETEVTGGGTRASGQLLDVGGAEFSGVRRMGDALEVRVWNSRPDEAQAHVEGARITLRPAEERALAVADDREDGWTRN